MLKAMLNAFLISAVIAFLITMIVLGADVMFHTFGFYGGFAYTVFVILFIMFIFEIE